MSRVTVSTGHLRGGKRTIAESARPGAAEHVLEQRLAARAVEEARVQHLLGARRRREIEALVEEAAPGERGADEIPGHAKYRGALVGGGPVGAVQHLVEQGTQLG